jgi:hypothetical protein
MSLPRVPTDSSNEKQHRTIIASTVNELVKLRQPNDKTSAEAAEGVVPLDQRYPPGDPLRNGAKGDGSTADDIAIQDALDSNGLVEFTS